MMRTFAGKKGHKDQAVADGSVCASLETGANDQSVSVVQTVIYPSR